MTEPAEVRLRRLHHLIHEQLTYGGYSPAEATELLADYAEVVLRTRLERTTPPR